ncbi:sensor histidine kinase [Chitinophaga nivalis]|uniref:histidine kinase n=1 Tax=Chitinophaga nivalis TaxID=2991709 RepID=A0ABT3IIM8_9BACT|nr:HAMP domain-containing sensor histidine kinase [Chitinophaga nivalis]MCW3466477.1 HAMP domain-containing histidine kinase [Chitinophaga nivalis]MCW3483832.1 HAMP domain-containing histidine kinase [Chitinophaga nivalis]
MKIRHRLSLQFTLISGILLTIVFVLIYLLSAQYIKNSFYKLLQMRALVTAQMYLEKDEVTKKKFLEIEKSYRERIPGESSNIYNQDNQPVFLEKIKYNWPPALLETIRREEFHRFTFGDKAGLGMYYKDNQGDFVVIVTARNKAGVQQLQYLMWILITMFCLALLVTFLMGQWYAVRALQPIQRINREVKDIRFNNLHLRVQEGRNQDEISELATNFNALLQHMEQAFDMQKSFVSNASHELRTPLTTIIGEIEVTLQNDRSKEDYITTLQTVLDESEKLKIITDGLLQLTRVDVILTDANTENIRLDEMLWEIQEHWQQKEPPLQVQVQLQDMPEDAAQLQIRGNRSLLMLALQNIVRNAFKFSYNQPVSCCLTWQPTGMVLAVTDHGIGIAAADLDKIFLPLYRAGNAHAFQGYGIGLSMTQKILQLHHASVTASSVLGVGTTFNIFFAAEHKI